MPRGDQTGPMGMGPMTGRGTGYCSGTGLPNSGTITPGQGFGLGYGRRGVACGRGYGWGNRWSGAAQPWRLRLGGYGVPRMQTDPEMQKQILKNQSAALQSELELIKKRLADMETGQTDE